MYEARQNKEKVSRVISAGGGTRQRLNINKDMVIQNVKDKFAESDKHFDEGYMTGLYAEHKNSENDTNVFSVIAWSSDTGHAEENLLSFLAQNGRTKGFLKIWLSTSPCSSKYGTGKGCQEMLESCGMTVEVVADHYYQPRRTGLESSKQASINAANNCSFKIKIKKGTLQLKY